MSEITDQTPPPPSAFALLARIGFQPRRTMRMILDSRGARGATLIVVILVIVRTVMGVPVASYEIAFDRLGVAGTIGIALAVLIAITAVSIGFYFLFAWIVFFAGRWLSGTAGWSAVRTAIAWSFAPLYWALLYRIPTFLISPGTYQAIFANDNELIRIGEETVHVSAVSVPFSQVLLAGIAEFLIVIWLFVTASRALAEVEGYTPWEGFANLLLGFVLPAVAAGIIALAAALSFRA